MITAILRDGSRWQSVQALYPTDPAEVVRLYRDKAIAGYLLSGVPEFVSLNLYATWQEPGNSGQSLR